jgi:hypothetical protein
MGSTASKIKIGKFHNGFLIGPTSVARFSYNAGCKAAPIVLVADYMSHHATLHQSGAYSPSRITESAFFYILNIP